ncbi:hypothetical protein BMS3Bbin16_01065 [archaeon BMS3Bbin16]|nr:hypothetical protein BMS3Bbin16_01065 [archaeon BMS3Bbin16]
MVKALFYIEGKKISVQHIGCRLIVTNELIHRGFTKGGAFNMPDGRVEVVLEGDKEKLIEAHKEVKENLHKWIINASEDREELKKKIGNPGIEVSELEFNDDLLVLDIGLFSHSLTFDQIYKGVDVYKELSKQSKELTRAIKNLNKTLEKKNKK